MTDGAGGGKKTTHKKRRTHHKKKTTHPKRRSTRAKRKTTHPKRRTTAKKTTKPITSSTTTTTLTTTTVAAWYQWLGYDCTAAFSKGYPVIETFTNVPICVYPSSWCQIMNPSNSTYSNTDARWISAPGNCAKLCYQNTNCGFFDYNGATLVCRLHSGNIYDGYQDGFCLAGQTNLNTGWIFSRINLGRG